jgi:hypothetical protein
MSYRGARKLHSKEQYLSLSKERLVDYIEIIHKNFWTLQGCYVLELERRYGGDVAMEFDDIAFGRAAEVQVYRLKKFFDLGDDMSALMKIFDFSEFCSNIEYEFHEVTEKRLIWRVTKCPMQLARLKDGLPEIACKLSAIPINEKIARAINPKMKSICIVCPPDPHSEDRWCEFEFKIET